MHRTTGQGHVNNLFVAENVNTGQAPTEITADWMNAVQEEICSVVEEAGLTLNVNNNAQLLQAIKSLVANSITGIGSVSENLKWDLCPVGHCQPFVSEIMGTDITTWLAAHPKWRRLSNAVVTDIEGRAMAVASGTHAAGNQAGSDNAVIVEHSHSATQESHNHTVPSYSSPGVLNLVESGSSINLSTEATSSVAPSITVANEGVSGVGKNIQRTQYFDWIYKHS